jgi:cellulose synthase/poly-beta-1,6-N-acetylglucosamine synthase-like glycosyltransferase
VTHRISIEISSLCDKVKMWYFPWLYFPQYSTILSMVIIYGQLLNFTSALTKVWVKGRRCGDFSSIVWYH